MEVRVLFTMLGEQNRIVIHATTQRVSIVPQSSQTVREISAQRRWHVDVCLLLDLVVVLFAMGANVALFGRSLIGVCSKQCCSLF
jgi:hypothetical protein